MSLTNKKYSAVHTKTGSEKNKLKAHWDEGHINTLRDLGDSGHPEFGALIYQIQEMQDELDYLRTEISSNKDNKTVIGSNTVVSFGDLTLTNKGAYQLTITATRDFGGKTGSQTKSVTLTLT